MDKNSKQNERLLSRITLGNSDLPPRFTDMEFMTYCNDGFDEFAWTIYISHDPCHDTGDFIDDRNTVVVFHRTNGNFRIIGRELPYKLAVAIATGEK